MNVAAVWAHRMLLTLTYFILTVVISVLPQFVTVC